MGFFRRQLLKVIEWKDFDNNTIVYRYQMDDRDEIMNGCKLIVAESQVAMLVSRGQIADVYGPGSHTLETGNMPILTKIAGWKYGFDSPFKADVYYVNTKQFPNLKWGTSSKVNMRDADFGVVRIGGRGTYSIKVNDAPTFMREIFGTLPNYQTSTLVDYFKSMIVSAFGTVLGKCKIPVLDLQAKYLELGELVVDELKDDFEKIGLELVALYVESIALPEEVEQTLDKRASLGVLEDKLGAYTQLQAAEAMRDAAKNEGMGGLAGAGVGLAAGMNMVNAMNGAFNQQNQQQAPQQSAPAQASGAVCSKCGMALAPGAKFCSNCGTPVAQKKFCSNCGKEIPSEAKFCPHCGSKA